MGDAHPDEPVIDLTTEDADATDVADAPPSTWYEINRRRERKPLRELPDLLRAAVRLVREAAPGDFRTVVALNIAIGVLTAVQLGLTQRLLSAVLAVGASNAVKSVLPELVAFVTVFVMLGVLVLVQGERQRILSELVTRHAQVLVATAAAQADLVDFERPEFHDRLQRTIANAGSRPIEITYSLMNIVGAVITALGIIVALAFVQPVLLLLVFVAFAPVWIIARQLSRISFRFDVQETEQDRRRNYLLMLLTMKQPAKEVRAFELAGFFTDHHARLWDERIGRLRRHASRRMRLGLAGQVINGVLFGVVVAVLVWLISTDRTTVSQAAVAAGAVVILGQRLGSIVSGSSRLYESSLFLGDVNGFLQDADDRRAAAPVARTEATLDEIRVENVQFRYPGGNHQALAGVSLHVRRGEVVALVGANGSGKTTLAKVLAQLYEPEQGTVEWNGIDCSTLDRAALRDRIAVIFQDFERYFFTGAENIGFGRSERIDDRSAVIEAAERAGADEFLTALPEGYDHLLGPEFLGGSDLSIGQWQRVAIARAFFRDAELVILDEPSSALDPDAEAALFERLRELCAGRAVVVVSHRFSTVTSADRICVLDGGRIIEQGTHQELMAAAGTYARLFRVQAAQYLDQGGTIR